MKRRYLTFEDRGVLVGFRARRMQFVRCRPSRTEPGGLEALVPNWTATGGLAADLVMKFGDLAGWGNLDGFDRVLFDRLVERARAFDGRVDPVLMREIRLAADVDLGDPAQAATARFELAISERDARRSLLEIIAMFGRHVAERAQKQGLHQLSGDVLFELADRSPEELRHLVRIIAKVMARGTDVSGDVLRQRLDMISEFAAPICSLVTADGEGVVGYLSRQYRMVETLHDTMRTWGEGQSHEMRSDAALICGNVTSFLLYAHTRAGDIRRNVLEERQYLDDVAHGNLIRAIAQERVRIAFALDGWSVHAAAWARALREDHDAQFAALALILRDMPKAPVELDEELSRVRESQNEMMFRGKLVKDFHVWSNDSLDRELYDRVVAGRESAARQATG